MRPCGEQLRAELPQCARTAGMARPAKSLHAQAGWAFFAALHWLCVPFQQWVRPSFVLERLAATRPFVPPVHEHTVK